MFECPFANRLYRDFELISRVDVKFGQWGGDTGDGIQYHPAHGDERGSLIVSSSDRRELIHEIAHWTVGRRDKVEYGLPTQEQQGEGKAEWGKPGELQTLALEYYWHHIAGLPPYVYGLNAVTGSRRTDDEGVQGLIRHLPHAARYSDRLPPEMVELIVETCQRLSVGRYHPSSDNYALGRVLTGLLTRLYGSFEDDDDAQAA